MTREELLPLLPEGKHDISRAEAVIALGYPAVAPILPELLQWLQDFNWPVAKILQPFLTDIGAPLIPFVRQIMQTNDILWKYWITVTVLRDSREIAGAFRDELKRIAQAPTEQEKQEELSEEALETLKVHGWQRPVG